MNKIKFYWHHLLRLSPILMLVFLTLWLRSCREAAGKADRYSTNLQAKDNSLRSYKLANGQLVHEKDLLTATNEELKEQVWLKDDSLQLLLKKLREPVVAVQWKTRYVYDTLYLPFEAPVPLEFRRDFSKREQWFFLSGSVTQDGVSIRELAIPNTQRLVVGYRKGQAVVSVTNSNPHLLTEAIEGQLIKVPKKHWVLGIGASWNIYEPPTAGFFLGYKLFDL